MELIRTQLILRGKGCRSTAPSQEEAEVPASVVASTTTSHPEASRQRGHLTTLPVPHMLSDPALGPCGIVKWKARTYSPSPTPQQGAGDQRCRKAMQSADIGEKSPGTGREAVGPGNMEPHGVVSGIVSQGQETDVNVPSSGAPMSLFSFHQSFKGNPGLSSVG